MLLEYIRKLHFLFVFESLICNFLWKLKFVEFRLLRFLKALVLDMLVGLKLRTLHLNVFFLVLQDFLFWWTCFEWMVGTLACCISGKSQYLCDLFAGEFFSYWNITRFESLFCHRRNWEMFFFNPAFSQLFDTQIVVVWIHTLCTQIVLKTQSF